MDGIIDFFDLNPSSYLYSQWLYLRLFSLVYLCAFCSMSIGVKGLWGKQGILSIKNFLEQARNRHPNWKRFYYIPSLFWISCSDRSLVLLVRGSILASIFSLFDILTVPMLFFLWLSWLSFLSTGSAFMRRQSDSLLAELGFYNIFYAMLSPPPLLALLYLWFCLFKFMFMAGFAKLASGDKSWRNGSAMSYHYETQPLPNRTSWYAAKLPLWAHRFCSYSMFVIELLVPFFILFPAPVRLLATFLLILLQIGIFATGNFTFLNILSGVFACVIVEDRYLEGYLSSYVFLEPSSPSLVLWSFISGVVLCLFIMSTLVFIVGVFKKRWKIPLLGYVSHFYLSNAYGLFAVMTKVRKEVVIEGSLDGKNWKEYEFPYKAGDTAMAPKQMAPHHPRLDWQMWFAALGNYKSYPWFINLLVRLLEGSKDVLELLRVNPFGEKSPKYIRAKLYRYEFTSYEERKQTACWWKREYLSDYTPVMKRDRR